MSNHCTFHNIEELRQAVGQEAFVTDWVLIDQKRIDLFAQATDDPQWIHVDPVRAAKESPFCKMGINYGLNRVRFTNPVKVDRQVRGRFVLAKLEDIAGGLQMTFTVTIEIQGEERPACVAESVVRQYFEAAV